MSTHLAAPRVLYLVVCAAPPAQRILQLVDALHAEGWSVHVIATATAAGWLPINDLTQRTGHPVLHAQRHPDQPSLLPPADAVAVVPATFNTINKWALGINDSLALGILNETLATDLPIIAALYAKTALTSHPSFAGHLRILADAGVHLTEPEALRPATDGDPFRWTVILDALHSLPARRTPPSR
jgi:phosphopantothenoylcysteine synthetase/decarboxylase